METKQEVAKAKSKYWSEPELINKTTWSVTLFNIDHKKEGDATFKSKQDAWTFLKTINIYMDGKLVHSAV
jgi:hypothetical protein